MRKPRADRTESLDPDVVSLNEKMSHLAHKLAGPDASFADFEMILLALRTEVMAQVRASLAEEAAATVEATAVPRPSPKPPRRPR